MFIAQKVDVGGGGVVDGGTGVAGDSGDDVSETAPITSSSLGPLKLSTTLLCSPSTSLPMMMSEHKSLMTSATTFWCFTPLTTISMITSPTIVACCFLLASGIVRCLGNIVSFLRFVVDTLIKVPELPVSIIASVVVPSTVHLVYDTFLLPSQASCGEWVILGEIG